RQTDPVQAPRRAQGQGEQREQGRQGQKGQGGPETGGVGDPDRQGCSGDYRRQKEQITAGGIVSQHRSKPKPGLPERLANAPGAVLALSSVLRKGVAEVARLPGRGCRKSGDFRYTPLQPALGPHHLSSCWRI